MTEAVSTSPAVLANENQISVTNMSAISDQEIGDQGKGQILI